MAKLSGFDAIMVIFKIFSILIENETIKCEEKKKGTTKCDKRIVTCDVGTTQCENRTIKCEDLITWYNLLLTF